MRDHRLYVANLRAMERHSRRLRGGMEDPSETQMYDSSASSVSDYIARIESLVIDGLLPPGGLPANQIVPYLMNTYGEALVNKTISKGVIGNLETYFTPEAILKGLVYHRRRTGETWYDDYIKEHSPPENPSGAGKYRGGRPRLNWTQEHRRKVGKARKILEEIKDRIDEEAGDMDQHSFWDLVAREYKNYFESQPREQQKTLRDALGSYVMDNAFPKEHRDHFNSLLLRF